MNSNKSNGTNVSNSGSSNGAVTASGTGSGGASATGAPPPPNNEKIKRGFKLTHQKLVLDLDLEKKSIIGHTELIIQPQTRKLRTEKIKLNCRQCFVSQIFVNGVETKFLMKNYMETVVLSPETRDMETYAAYTRAASYHSDEGELAIDIPPSVVFYKEGGGSDNTRNIVQFSPLSVVIHYRLCNPQGGIVFVDADTEHPLRRSHMYTYQQPESARLWFPTCDLIYEKCTWELDLTVNANLVAIATGQLLEKVCNEDETKNTFIYRQDTPTCASSIGICVGAFEIYPDPHLANVTHFCLPHKLEDLQHSLAFFHHVYHFYEDYLGSSFPYGSYKQVFVEDLVQPFNSFATLTLFNSHMLFGKKIIDQVFETRRIVASALSKQWFGLYLSPKSYSDLWLLLGLSGYLTNQFVKKHFGYNEYMYQLLKDEELVAQLDNGYMPPLFNEYYTLPIELYSEVNIKKAPLVFYMIEKRISEDSLRKILNSLLHNNSGASLQSTNPQTPSISNSLANINTSQSAIPTTMDIDPPQANQSSSGVPNAANEPTPSNASLSTIDTYLQTKKFLKLLKTVTGNDFKVFAEKWIYGKACPQLVCGFNFNRKKFQTEFAMKQLYTRSEDKFSGNLTIRIRDLDTTIEQSLTFDDEIIYDFPCQSRCRKSKKKKLVAGDGEEMEIDLSMKRDTPLLWIRIDPEHEFIHKVIFKQPEYMWIHQMELDKDVTAQLEAARGLRDFPTSSASKAVYKFFSDKQKYFYRVRQEAAMTLAKIAVKETSYEGMSLLLEYFRENYFDVESNQMAPNSFSDFPAYFIQKIIPMAVATVKDKEQRTPMEGIDFLLSLLKDNNNSLNKYSDNFYLEVVITAVGNIYTTNQTHIKKLVKQIHRYLKYDQLFPSYKNTVSSACLRALCEFQCTKMIPLDFKIFRDHTGYSHFEDVRKTAFQCIFKLYYHFQPAQSLSLLGVKNSSLVEFLLDSFEKEKSPMIKHFLMNMLSSAPVAQEEKSYITQLKDDYKLVERLWSYLNSSVTSYDFALRLKVMKLYKYIWNRSTPSVFVRRLKSIKGSGHSNLNGHKSKSGSSSSKDKHHRSSGTSGNNSGGGGSSNSSKKRKSTEDQSNYQSDQPLKIHIKLSDTNIPIATPSAHPPPGSVAATTTTAAATTSTHSNSSNGNNVTINTIPEEPKKSISIDENDMNDPDLKEFLEIKNKEKHFLESKDKERRHKERSKSHHHRERSHSSNSLSQSSESGGSEENSTIIENSTTSHHSSHHSSSHHHNHLPKSLDLDMDDEFKKDLEMIEDFNSSKDRRSTSSKSSHHSSHHSSSHHREHGSGSHREHSSSSHHRDHSKSEHREHSSGSSGSNSNGSSSSSHRDREHSSSHREHGSSHREHSSSHRRHSSSHREHREKSHSSSSTATSTTSSSGSSTSHNNTTHFPPPIITPSSQIHDDGIEVDILNSMESEKRPIDEHPLPVHKSLPTTSTPPSVIKLPIKIPAQSFNTNQTTESTSSTPSEPMKIIIKNSSDSTTPASTATATTPPNQQSTGEKPKFVLRLSLGNNTITKQL